MPRTNKTNQANNVDQISNFAVYNIFSLGDKVIYLIIYLYYDIVDGLLY